MNLNDDNSSSLSNYKIRPRNKMSAFNNDKFIDCKNNPRFFTGNMNSNLQFGVVHQNSLCRSRKRFFLNICDPPEPLKRLLNLIEIPSNFFT